MAKYLYYLRDVDKSALMKLLFEEYQSCRPYEILFYKPKTILFSPSLKETVQMKGICFNTETGEIKDYKFSCTLTDFEATIQYKDEFEKKHEKCCDINYFIFMKSAMEKQGKGDSYYSAYCDNKIRNSQKIQENRKKD